MADKTVYVQPVGDDRGVHYHTLAAAVAGEVANLVTMGGMLYIEIRGDWSGGADTTLVDIDGYTTDATHYIKIYTDSANRAGGIWSTSKYIRRGSDATVFLMREDYTWIDGLQIEEVSQTGAQVFFNNVTRNSGLIKISNCILRGDGGAQRLKFYGESSGLFTSLQIWNCICYNWGSHADSYFSENSAITASVYNSTFIVSSTVDFALRNDIGTSLIVKNCYAGGSSNSNYNGIMTRTTCASKDATGEIKNIAINTTNFKNVTGGTEDYRLPLGSALIGVGTDDAGLGLYSDDIEGHTRTSTWDIGADEYIAAVGVTFTEHRSTLFEF